MEDPETWENFKYRQDCRFRVGDWVTIKLSTARRFSIFKDELARIKGYDAAEIRKSIREPVGADEQNRMLIRLMKADFPPLYSQVVMTHFEKSIRAWVIWFMTEKGEVFRVEQDLLIFLGSNFKSTQKAIKEGSTAREILGLSKESPDEPKKYFTAIFKTEPKDE